MKKKDKCYYFIMKTSKHLLIIHHSQTGATKKMTDAVISGANKTNINIRSLSALKATSKDMLWADAVIFGTPENFGYMSGAMKFFFDTIYYECIEKIDGLPYAIYIKAGNDGLGARNSIEKILSGLSLKKIHNPIIIAGPLTSESLIQCEDLGHLVAMGVIESIF